MVGRGAPPRTAVLRSGACRRRWRGGGAARRRASGAGRAVGRQRARARRRAGCVAREAPARDTWEDRGNVRRAGLRVRRRGVQSADVGRARASRAAARGVDLLNRLAPRAVSFLRAASRYHEWQTPPQHVAWGPHCELTLQLPAPPEGDRLSFAPPE